MTSKWRGDFFIRYGFLVLVVVSIWASNASADDDGDEFVSILERIRTAQQQVSYVGKQLSVHWAPNGCFVREEQVVHQPPSTHIVKLLLPLEPPRAIFGGRERRRGEGGGEGRQWGRGKGGPPMEHRPGPGFFSPDARQLSIELMSQEEITLLTRNYTHSRTLSEMVAGHPTDLLVIAPKFEGRPTGRFWIARDKGIVLRREDYDAQGQLRSLAVYSQIDFREPQVQEALKALQAEGNLPDRGRSSLEKPVTLTEAREALSDQLALPAYLPPGFQLQRVGLMQPPGGVAVHLRYTDGLMVLSLFEDNRDRQPPERPMDGPGQWQGEVENLRGVTVQVIDLRQLHILRWVRGKAGFTLIGELNRDEMTQIAASLISGEAQ